MSNRTRRQRLLAAALVAAPSLAISQGAWATAYTFVGTSPTDASQWTDPANWNPNTGFPSISGDTATFTGTVPTGSISLNGTTQSLNSLNFATTGMSYNIGVTSGDALNFDANGSITVNPDVTAAQATGAAILANGPLNVANNGAAGLTLNAVTLNGGGALNVTSTATNSATTLNGAIADGTGGAGSLAITTNGTVAANANVFINANNTYSGGTTLGLNTGSAGSIQINADSPFGIGKVTVNTGINGTTSALNFQAVGGARKITNAIDFNAGVGFIGNNGITLSGPINALFNSGNTTPLFSNSVSNGAVVNIGDPSSPSTITLGNSTVGGTTALINAAAGSTMVINDVMQDPAGGGHGGVQYGGATGGTILVHSLNTYSGTTVLNGFSTLQFDHSYNPGDPSGPFGVGTIQPNNSTNNRLQPIGGDKVLANPIFLNVGITVNNAAGDNSGLTLAGPITMGTAGRTITNSFNGGTLTLGLANSPQPFIMASGTSTQTLTFAGTGTAMIVNDNLQQSGTSVTNISVTAAGLTLNGAISGSGNISVGSTTASIAFNSGQSTYSGTTTFNYGHTVSIGASSTMSGTSVVSGPFGTGTVVFNTSNSNLPTVITPAGADRTVGNPVQLTTGFIANNTGGGNYNLTFAGPVTLANASRVINNNMNAGTALTFGQASAPSTFSLGNGAGNLTLTIQSNNGSTGSTIINDVIQNSTGGGVGSVVIKNVGPVYLNAKNTYTGNTTVVGAGTGSSAVGTGGTLAGVGTVGVGGTVTLSSTAGGTQGGIVAPGAAPGSAGTLSVPSMVLDPYGRYAFEFNGTDTTVGNGVNDLINGAGTLSLSNLSSSAPFDLNLTQLTIGNGSPETYTIATFAGGITGGSGDVTPDFTFSGTGYTGTPTVAVSGNSLQLTFTPANTPEPSSVALLGVALGALGIRPRRKRRGV